MGRSGVLGCSAYSAINRLPTSWLIIQHFFLFFKWLSALFAFYSYNGWAANTSRLLSSLFVEWFYQPEDNMLSCPKVDKSNAEKHEIDTLKPELKALLLFIWVVSGWPKLSWVDLIFQIPFRFCRVCTPPSRSHPFYTLYLHLLISSAVDFLYTCSIPSPVKQPQPQQLPGLLNQNCSHGGQRYAKSASQDKVFGEG